MTNDSDALNGDVSSVDALLTSPGPDGISLREAIGASNNAPGPETIEFAAGLKGAVIKLYSSRIFAVLALSGGSTTVNGDIDGDGVPDITLQPNRPDRDPGTAFSIASNNNTVNGLRFVDFGSEPFNFYVCPPPRGPCGDRVLKGNRIMRNIITGGLAGIGVVPRSQGRFESDSRIEDTLIAGNVISGVASVPIGVNPGVSGGSRNHVVGTIIVANRVSGGSPKIAVIAGDTPSDYTGNPPDVRARRPVEYADSNVIRDTIISGNIVEGATFAGISVEAGILGNQRNSVLCTKIIGNTISHLEPGGQGIVVSTSNHGGSRVTSNNLIADVEIRKNRIAGVRWGILIGPGGKLGGFSGEGANDNRLEGVVVSENEVRDYQGRGILIWGGMTCSESTTYTVSNNVLEGLTVRSNLLTSQLRGPTVGIQLLGGWGCPGPVLGNRVDDVDISANTIRDSNIGIQLAGGLGPGAQNNRVSNVRLQENRVENTRDALRIANNEEGAINNQVEVSRP